MRIKVFKAADIKEAMAMVKEELGSDAVILHTKRYHEGGFLGYKSKEVVEVTAAVEDETKQKPRQRTVRSSRAKPQSTPMTAARPKTVVRQYVPEAREDVQNPSVRHQNQVKTYAEPDLLPKEAVPTKKSIPSVMAKVRPVKSSVVQVATDGRQPVAPATRQGAIAPVVAEKPVYREEPAVATPADTVEKDEKIQALEREIAEMKLMLQQVMGSGAKADFVTLQEVLKAQEVSTELMDDLLKKMPAMSLMLEGTSAEAQKVLSDYLTQSLSCTEGITLRSSQPTIVALIGTTGVGKTTTLAKIAARFVLEKGVSAALITADTYRISAVEQLRTYSDIIGLPLEIVYSPAELKAAIEKFRNKQLILIDTAGRSQNNEFQMKELLEFLRVEPSLEKHLVLSATTKDKDVELILDKFAPCKPDRLIFTKLDETASYGPIANILFKRKLSLSYLTNGQSVPDDIVPATPEVLAKLLLG